MRLSTRFKDERKARIFCDYLLAQGIETQVREGDSAEDWELWVLDDDQIELVVREANAYEATPEAPKYQATRSARRIRRQQEKEKQWAQRNYVDARTKFLGGSALGNAPVTAWLIGISVVLTLAVWGIPGGELQDLLSFVPLDAAYVDLGGGRFVPLSMEGRFYGFLGTMATFQIWRLLTPIFMHGSVLHIAFNMLWLYQLGSALEWRKSSRFMLAITLFSGIPSNFLQYILVGPRFLGMSGVVYGLLGYLWISQRHGNSLRIHLSTTTYYLMFGWLALGFIAPSMGMANWAHLGGLVMGVLMGGWPNWRRNGFTRF